MEIQRAFTYQFDDVQWPTKLGMGALISLVPILNLAVVGYEVDVVRNVASGLREPLPQWDDLGQKWIKGLLLTLAGLVYAIPVFVAMGVVFAVLVASGALAQNSNGPARGLAVASVVALACFFVFLLLYSLLLSLLRPVILVLFAREGTFESCFRFREIARVINRQPGAFLTTWAVIILAGLAIGFVVGFVNLTIGWVPCIGWTIGVVMALGTAIYLLTVDGYIYGQYWLAAFENGNQAISQSGH